MLPCDLAGLASAPLSGELELLPAALFPLSLLPELVGLASAPLSGELELLPAALSPLSLLPELVGLASASLSDEFEALPVLSPPSLLPDFSALEDAGSGGKDVELPPEELTTVVAGVEGPCGKDAAAASLPSVDSFASGVGGEA